MKNIVYKLLFTCEEATLLMERKMSAESIGVIDNIRLRGHIAICRWCRAYSKKVTIIDAAITRLSERSNKEIEEAEIRDFQNQLIERTLK